MRTHIKVGFKAQKELTPPFDSNNKIRYNFHTIYTQKKMHFNPECRTIQKFFTLETWSTSTRLSNTVTRAALFHEEKKLLHYQRIVSYF